MRKDIAEIARTSLLLATVPDATADLLLARATARRFPRGTTLFAQGDRADAIFIVAKGWVKLYRNAASGTEAVVGVFTKGQSFGEAVALRADSYPVSAETVTDSTLVRIDARALKEQIEESPDVAISMLTATYAHLHSLVAQIEQLKALSGAQRVADFLLDLTGSQGGACSVDLPYDKILIAGRLGMKPESLSRAFVKLRDHGVTMHQHSAEIGDVDALRAFAERDRAEAWHRD